MAEEIRRSGRANKGHHTKNADALDEPAPKSSSKSKSKKGQAQPSRSQSAQTPEHEEGGDEIIRCVCGDNRDITGRQMICCDQCEAWQHNQCLNLPGSKYWANKSYFCERCHPHDHVELLAAMARGEKPWNRKNKKGKKAKSRPSDVDTDPNREKATPPSSKLSTPVPVPDPAEAPAKTPTPAPRAPNTAPQAAQETSNGQAKSSKKGTPKSQPQSPLGEKRRHESITEKDPANKKRRKSSAAVAEKPDSPPSLAATIDALPAKQRPMVEKLRDNIVPHIDAAVAAKRYEIPDGESAIALASKFALEIHRAVLLLGDPEKQDSPFSVQFRSIIFNSKKNAILTDRLLSGSLTPDEFATMSAEEMASEDKQKEYAALREANEKQMVLTEETGPRLRKTHKGEEFIGGDEGSTNDEFRAPPPRDREDIIDARPAQPPSPVQDGHAAVELPEELGQRAPLAVDTSSTPMDEVRRPSSNFDINSVFDKVRSPQADQQAFLQRRQSSIRTQETPRQGPGDDADIDRLLKDEDNDVEMSGYRADPSVVWKGTVQMQQMEPFEASARFVAGGDFGQIIPWEKLLAPLLPIQGRIENNRGDDYIQGLAKTGTHDVCVLSLAPTTEEGRGVMEGIYNYFHPRHRWGVVSIESNEALRDLYVVPLEPGTSDLPPFLDMLEYCTIEMPRKEPMMLLALIARLPETKPVITQPVFEPYPAQTTPSAQINHPVQAPNGPSPSPVNPHAPQYSPMNTAFPPPHLDYNNGNAFPLHQPHHPHHPPAHNGHAQAQQGAQMPHPPAPTPPIPLAIEILGPYLNAPVIGKILATSEGGASMSREIMLNLKHIMDTVPDARHDFGVFQQHLADQAKADAGS
ncbi:hypothetical protein P280DRAFT_471222 [Massarina eburnea CBS 473.64]|uniref:Transcription factor BYE1 n=1 Tax=Massarina eburnea CBS 473.64 TaxID=1395130 RepID=A0A6A6RUF7_9PLEO|nr:hypothetical protein P280DRAFT_471222 [Massarina eburnea CBS 473.64]